MSSYGGIRIWRLDAFAHSEKNGKNAARGASVEMPVIWRAKCPPTMLFNLKSQHVLKVYKHYYCVWGNRKSQIAERKTVSIRGGLNSSMIIEMIFFRLIRIQTLLQAPSTFLLIVANRRIVFSLSCFTAVVPRFATVCHFCRGQ